MIQSDEHQHHTICTPELVELSFPLAGVARRCMAMLIDQMIVGAFLALLWIGLGVTVMANAQSLFAIQNGAMTMMLLVCGVILVSVISYMVYFWACHTFWRGQTIGKKLMNTRLVTDRGGVPNGMTCFIRVLFDVLDMMLLYGSVGVIMILVTKQEKRIADFAAGTLVILDQPNTR